MRKKIVVLTITLAMTASIFAGCGQRNTTQETAQKTEVVEQEDQENPELANLIKQENAILEEHKEVWDKVFAKVDNLETAEKMEQGQTYLEYLKESTEKAQSDLTDDEKEVLQKDLAQIEEIEKQVAELEAKGEK